MVSPTKLEFTERWINFFLMYWQMLNAAQKESYIALFYAEKEPPDLMKTGELPPAEQLQILKHLGDVIKSYREKRKITQMALSEMIGISPAYLSMIETGRRSFKFIDVVQIATILKIPYKELFLISQ